MKEKLLMKGIKKRLFSVVLALAMVLTLMPNVTAFADMPEDQVHDGITFEAWTETNSLPNEDGNWYLTNDVKINKTWKLEAKKIKLCLNGHSITNTGKEAVIFLKYGAELSVYDCDTTEHPGHLEDYKWVPDEEAGEENVPIIGGYITGGKRLSEYATYPENQGSGVYMEGGVFNMYGGNIVGNEAADGAGVHLQSENSKFNMYAGKILGNKAEDFGAGVFIFREGGTFNMYGGSIELNRGTNVGSAVHNKGSFTMTGGSISKNSYMVAILNRGSFTMTGGSITGHEGGGVMNDGPITVGGNAVIKGNTRKDMFGGSPSAYNLQLSDQPITISEEKPPVIGEGGLEIYFNPNYNRAGQVVVESGATEALLDCFKCDYQSLFVEYSDGSLKTQKLHIHEWNYNADGATLKAYCSSEEECANHGTETDLSKALSLTLSASETNYEGSAATITIGTAEEKAAWEAAKLEVPTTIVYEKEDGTALDAAPTTEGSYVAKVCPADQEATADNTAKVSFKIEKKPEEPKPEESDAINYYEDVKPADGVVKDITNTGDAPKESNPYTATIVNSTELESLVNVTAEEKAQGVNVWIKLVDASSTMPEADKTMITSTAGTSTVGMFFDASLFKKVGDKDEVAIHDVNGKIKLSFVLPEALRRDGRNYSIIRVHNGEVATIAGTYDATAHTITFETDKFSSYALIYNDEVAVAPVAGVAATVAAAAPATPASVSPKTGDNTNVFAWMILMIAGLGVFGYGFFMRKKENK